ncbi:hypothetical protein MHK_004771 [Candidatus Magnetomorum sp. HK-1]|nr:hypothetical protein MHK_004771 [Candidatus Magnetomorum sp. HK-1]
MSEKKVIVKNDPVRGTNDAHFVTGFSQTKTPAGPLPFTGMGKFYYKGKVDENLVEFVEVDGRKIASEKSISNSDVEKDHDTKKLNIIRYIGVVPPPDRGTLIFTNPPNEKGEPATPGLFSCTNFVFIDRGKGEEKLVLDGDPFITCIDFPFPPGNSKVESKEQNLLYISSKSKDSSRKKQNSENILSTSEESQEYDNFKDKEFPPPSVNSLILLHLIKNLFETKQLTKNSCRMIGAGETQDEFVIGFSGEEPTCQEYGNTIINSILNNQDSFMGKTIVLAPFKSQIKKSYTRVRIPKKKGKKRRYKYGINNHCIEGKIFDYTGTRGTKKGPRKMINFTTLWRGKLKDEPEKSNNGNHKPCISCETNKEIILLYQ